MLPDEKNSLYCPTCAEKVEVYQAEVQEILESRCVFCGQVLQREKAASAGAMGVVLTAEDSTLLREMLTDVLLEKKITPEVQSFKNGQDMVTAFTQTMISQRNPSVVILDVIMPIMNGYFTALAIRAIEKAYKKKRKTPILFLSSRSLDKDFEKIINFCKPCYYLKKGLQTEGPEQLGKKMEEVLSKILSKVPVE